jgi:adenine-specific DNA-methyltransferase
VWNRHKDQLTNRRSKRAVRVIWAESVTAEGRFLWRSDKRNHAPYFLPRDCDEWLMVREPCVLVQRTTAKEQQRRLISAYMPASVLGDGPVTVENHLNMVRASGGRSIVPPMLLAEFLNSSTADRAFRCLNGSVAVSASELANLPLPDPVEFMCALDGQRRRQAVELASARLYGTL